MATRDVAQDVGNPWAFVECGGTHLGGWVLGIFVAAAGIGLVLGVAVLVGCWDISNGRGFMPVLFVLAVLGAVIAGLLRGRRFSRALRARRTIESARVVMAIFAPRLASLREGITCVRGTVVHGATVQSMGGHACLAWALAETPASGGEWQVSGGATFDVLDARGGVIRIDATHVIVCGGVRAGSEILVPRQAEVEVLGEARWMVDAEGTAKAGYREPLRLLVVTGSPTRPLIVRAHG